MAAAHMSQIRHICSSQRNGQRDQNEKNTYVPLSRSRQAIKFRRRAACLRFLLSLSPAAQSEISGVGSTGRATRASSYSSPNSTIREAGGLSTKGGLGSVAGPPQPPCELLTTEFLLHTWLRYSGIEGWKFLLLESRKEARVRFGGEKQGEGRSALGN